MSEATVGIVSIDQGTTSTRAMLFSLEGKPLFTASEEFNCHYPHPGWVEQNPLDLIDTTVRVCEKVVSEAKSADITICAIGLTNQRETTLVWDRETGKAISPAIVWQDRRTQDTCESLSQQGVKDEIRQKTGLLLDPYFSATKVAWILDNVSGARRKAEEGKLMFGTVDCFLMYHLSDGKEHVTDITNASRTMLFNINTLDWDEDLLKIFNIPKSMLPRVLPCDAKFTMTKKFGLEYEVPIHGCAGDQQAAAFGQGCFEFGEIKSTYGTGCFVLMQIGDQTPKLDNPLLATIGYQLQSVDSKLSYAIEGSIFNAGTPVQWLRDKLGIISNASEVENHAKQLKDNQGVYFVPAFTGLGAPHWNPLARAAISGLSRDSGREHISRAAIEAVGYQTNDILQMFDNYSYSPKFLLVDGGMTANNWLMQFISNICALPVKVAKVQETTALGAMMLAGLGANVISGLDEVKKKIHHVHTFHPRMDAEERSQLTTGWNRAVKSVISSVS